MAPENKAENPGEKRPWDRCRTCGHYRIDHDSSTCRGIPAEPQTADMDGACPCNGFEPKGPGDNN